MFRRQKVQREVELIFHKTYEMLDSIYDPFICFHLTTIYARDLAVNVEIINNKILYQFSAKEKGIDMSTEP